MFLEAEQERQLASPARWPGSYALTIRTSLEPIQ